MCTFCTTVNVSSPLMFRGMQLQARSACGDSDIAIGTFRLEENERLLQLLDCNNNNQVNNNTMKCSNKAIESRSTVTGQQLLVQKNGWYWYNYSFNWKNVNPKWDETRCWPGFIVPFLFPSRLVDVQLKHLD